MEHKEHENSNESSTNKDFISSIQEKFWNNKKTIFFLFLIFILALGIRANLVRYDGNYLFEPDASYHARMVQELVTNGSVAEIDPLNYYQVEGGVKHQPAGIYHYISAFIYFIVAFGQPFNKELLLFTIQFMPCIFGALISIEMYFLGKETFNDKKIGYIAAFLAAVTPAFAYRTMAGAQGDNSLGFLWMVIGFYFLVISTKKRTLNKKDILNAILAGIFFLIMSMTWDVFLLIPLIIIPYFIFGILLIATETKKENFNKSEVIHFAVKVILSLFVMSVGYFIPFINNFIRTSDFWLFSLAGNIAGPLQIDRMIVVGLILVLTLIGIIVAYYINQTGKETKKIIETLTIIALIFGVIALIGVFFIEPDFFYRNDGRSTLGSMVGEESVGNQFFGTKYNSLIIFPWLAILIFPLGAYFFKKEDSYNQLIFFFWTITTLFMAWYKLKFTFIFGLGLVAGAALACYLIFEALKKMNIEKGLEAKITTIIIGFLLVLGVGAAGIFIPDYAPFPNSNPSQIETMNWISENTPEEAKFFNWWNEGHVLALHTERKFSSDNKNASSEANALYGEFNTTTDINRGYEIASKTIGADYIYLETSNIYSLPTFEYYVNDKIDSRLAQKYYKGNFTILDCYELGDNVICGSNQLPKTEFEKFSTTWKNIPDAFPDGTNPAFYYRSENQILILNQTINNTNLAKVLLNSNETKNLYETVFSSGTIRIIKVIK